MDEIRYSSGNAIVNAGSNCAGNAMTMAASTAANAATDSKVRGPSALRAENPLASSRGRN